MDLNKHFSKEDIQMANWYKKTCPAAIIIREMQIETMVSHHLTPVRVDVIKKTRTIAVEDVESQGNLCVAQPVKNLPAMWETLGFNP